MKTKLAFIAIFFILGFAGFCQEAVDLGLSVKWATCNVGANKPEKYGKYYTFKEAKKLSNSNWRVPTIEEMEELVKNCDYKWTTQNGVNGGLFTSKTNGNSIFLPAAHRTDTIYRMVCDALHEEPANTENAGNRQVQDIAKVFPPISYTCAIPAPMPAHRVGGLHTCPPAEQTLMERHRR